VKDIGIACGQGYFIGRPAERPNTKLPAEAELAFADARVPVVNAPRLRAGTEPHAHDFVQAVDPALPDDTMWSVAQRFEDAPSLAAIPIVGEGGVEGVISRTIVDPIGMTHDARRALERPCIEYADRAPIKVEASLDLTALAAILVETDARHLADGFVIVSEGRYLGMGSSQDVIRSLQGSRVLAARYTNPLTMLPGQVPIHEHLERLLARHVPFTAWFIEIDHMRGLNDCAGYTRGDALIHAGARLLESMCQPGVDFAGHVSGARFVVLMQSEDWSVRADRLVEAFPALLEAHLPREALERGYFIVRSRDGRENVRPLPRLGVGILPVLPGVFETRHEVVSVAKQAVHQALLQPGSSVYVDQHYGNAYPQSLLFNE
jgi:GGDEF domain-containing protein